MITEFTVIMHLPERGALPLVTPEVEQFSNDSTVTRGALTLVTVVFDCSQLICLESVEL